MRNTLDTPVHLIEKIYVLSAYGDPEPINFFLKIASLDKLKKYKLVNDPITADIILFVENSRYHSDYFFRKLLKHPVVKEYKNKVYMYNPHDHPWFIIPGLYTSMPAMYFNRSNMAAVPYVESINPYINYVNSANPKFLFSFIGNSNSAQRREILRLNHSRAIIRGTPQNMFNDKAPKDSKVQYAEILSDSKFVLCPKGAGTSSFRIFETMQAGRVPVIISDNWVRPSGPNWDKFSVFVSDNQIKNIPSILEEEEVNWAEKAKLSRQAWETYFAPDVLFNYFVDNIIHIKANKYTVTMRWHMNQATAFAQYYFTKLVLSRMKVFLSKFNIHKR